MTLTLVLLGIGYSIVFMPFVWIGIRIGLSRENRSLKRRLVWGVYLLGLLVLAVITSARLLDYFEIREPARRGDFILSWLVPYAGASALMVLRALVKRSHG